MHKYVKRAITPSNFVTATINDFHLCDTQFFNAQPKPMSFSIPRVS